MNDNKTAYSGKDYTLDPRERPIPFNNTEEAQAFMDTWSGGITEGTKIIYLSQAQIDKRTKTYTR